MPRYLKKRGGSKASDLVMESNPKLCDDIASPVIEGPKIEGKVSDLTLYNTTGGGKIRRNKSKKRRSCCQSKDIVKYRKNNLKGGRRRNNGEHAGDICNGGGKNRKSLRKSIRRKVLKRKNSLKKSRKNKSSKKLKKRGGSKRIRNSNMMRSDFRGGSDWRSTVYSRGPVNVPNQDPAQFRMFTQHGKYIPQDSLRTQSFMQ